MKEKNAFLTSSVLLNNFYFLNFNVYFIYMKIYVVIISKFIDIFLIYFNRFLTITLISSKFLNKYNW